MKMTYSPKNCNERDASKKLAELESKVREVRLQEKLGKKKVHYDAKNLLNQ